MELDVKLDDLAYICSVKAEKLCWIAVCILQEKGFKLFLISIKLILKKSICFYLLISMLITVQGCLISYKRQATKEEFIWLIQRCQFTITLLKILWRYPTILMMNKSSMKMMYTNLWIKYKWLIITKNVKRRESSSQHIEQVMF